MQRIRGNHAAERQLHDVAGRKFGGGRIRPCPVAADGRGHRQPRLQRGESRLRVTFLKISQRGVENEKNAR